MSSQFETVASLALVAFLTSPIWYPLFAVDRLTKEIRAAERQHPTLAQHLAKACLRGVWWLSKAVFRAAKTGVRHLRDRRGDR